MTTATSSARRSSPWTATSQLFTGRDGGASAGSQITVTNTGTPDQNTSVNVTVTLSGVNQFLTDFSQDEYDFTLDPGDQNSFSLTPNELSGDMEAAMEQADLDGELLSGSIHVVATATTYTPDTVVCEPDGTMEIIPGGSSTDTVLDADALLFRAVHARLQRPGVRPDRPGRVDRPAVDHGEHVRHGSAHADVLGRRPDHRDAATPRPSP